MIFENLIKENKEAFKNRLLEIARELNVTADNLMFVFWFETAHTLNHRIQNARTKATGLIQFMPATAKELGTTVEELKSMSNVEQLEYVRKYFSRYRGKMKDWLDVYLVVFYPSLIGKPDDYKITRDIVAIQNPIFDRNKDLDISKSEIRKTLLIQMPEEAKKVLVA